MAHRPVNGIDAVLVPIGGGLYDLSFDPAGDIETDDFFDTNIIVALLADRRADESEVPEPERRRGWIGDESTPGLRQFSKLWLYYQARSTRATRSGLEDAARDALQGLVDDGYAVSIKGATVTPTSNGLSLEVTIERPGGVTETRFFDLWNRTGVS